MRVRLTFILGKGYMSGNGLESLRAFQTWFFSPAGPGIRRIPLCAPIHQKEGITALTLYRRNGYQAELAIVPPGQDYEIDVPKGMNLSFVFLGGSFYYDDSPLSKEEILRTARQTAPEAYREEISAIMARPDYLELPHPARPPGKNPPFLSLLEGRKTAFIAPEQTGIILLFGRYETDKAHSCLEHVSLLPPSLSSAKVTSRR